VTHDAGRLYFVSEKQTLLQSSKTGFGNLASYALAFVRAAITWSAAISKKPRYRSSNRRRGLIPTIGKLYVSKRSRELDET
jgi:hypothetical protein